MPGGSRAPKQRVESVSQSRTVRGTGKLAGVAGGGCLTVQPAGSLVQDQACWEGALKSQVSTSPSAPPLQGSRGPWAKKA